MNKKTKILIVDDNVSLCRTMSFVLRRKGYEVATAYDGPEAVEIARDRPFDVAFMDMKMPVLNGVETFKRIKKIRPGAAVMMMTAYAVDEMVEEALEEGAMGIIYKPVDMKRAIEIVETVSG